MNGLRFIKRLPVYWNRERDYQAHVRSGLRHEVICYDNSIRFVCPNDALVFAQFQNHVFESWQRKETRHFLELAKGCRSFIDIGASAGIMSLLFCASRATGTLLSVEPEARSLRLLREAQALNAKTGLDWKIAPCVLSDQVGSMSIDVSEFGATVAGVHPTQSDKQVIVDTQTLSSLCGLYNIEPDLLKLDIESYEYEVITSSKELLGDVQPRIQLELHVGMIQRRGENPLEIMQTLYDVGYSEQYLGRDWKRWEDRVGATAAQKFPVSHFWFTADREQS